MQPNHPVSGGGPRSLDRRDRVVNALGGIIPAAIGIPITANLWAPTWFLVAWCGVYVAMSVFFLSVVISRFSMVDLERRWSTAAAVCFCAIPVSAWKWSTDESHYWAALTVSVVFVAFEIAALPFLQMREWRVGVGMVAIVTVVFGVLTMNPFAALCLAPLFLTMIQGADRIRGLKQEFDERLAEANHAVHSDTLTGLLNRRGLAAQIDSLDGENLTVALIDVDRFKMINDTHGHQVGDQVLRSIAAELSRRFDPAFSLARLGGDEFVAIAQGSQVLPEELADPTRVEIRSHGQVVEIECGLSIGASYGINVESAHRLLNEAGYAMRESKRAGGLSHFDDELAERLDRMLEVAAIGAGTGDLGEFVPVAQLIVNEEKIVGCELLVRWDRPNGEVLPPDLFLPMAVEAGLMPAINEQMLTHAIRFASRFNGLADAPFVSVNVSAPHLGDSGFHDCVALLLGEHQVPPQRLMIEITEYEQLAGYSRWEATAASLRDLGVQLAIDDFGTGYSSIERLRDLPITHLKFDQSLVKNVHGPVGKVTQGVAAFASAVNIGVIAEGVETLEELESMRGLNVSVFQGFLFHRPERLDVVEAKIIEDWEQGAERSTESSLRQPLPQ